MVITRGNDLISQVSIIDVEYDANNVYNFAQKVQVPLKTMFYIRPDVDGTCSSLKCIVNESEIFSANFDVPVVVNAGKIYPCYYNANGVLEVTSAHVLSGDVDSYSIVETTASVGYAKSYILTVNGTQVGAKIDIPKDLVVSSGSVKSVTAADSPYSGAVVGDKYIELVLNDSGEDKIYVPAKSLVDVYTAGNGIAISSTNGISVKLSSTTNGLSVTSSGLALALASTSSAGAMSAADKVKLNSCAVVSQLTQAQYDALATKDSNTLYVIVG